MDDQDPQNNSHSYVRIYNDSSNESHFEDLTAALNQVDYAPPAPAMSASTPADCAKCMFLKAEAGWDGSWHPTPVRQFIVITSGEVVIEVTDGERRSFSSGDVIFLEDTEGRGHYTRAPEDSPCHGFVVHL